MHHCEAKHERRGDNGARLEANQDGTAIDDACWYRGVDETVVFELGDGRNGSKPDGDVFRKVGAIELWSEW